MSITMYWWRASVLIVFVVFASHGYAQTLPAKPGADAPDFRVQVWSDSAADFNMRVSIYFELRRGLEKGLPALTVTDDPAEIETAERALAARILVARARARQGDIFTPAIGVAFRKVLAAEVNAEILAVILDDNPGAFSHRINRVYPKARPMSTVPGNILAVLPTLPDDIQYRFLGRHLILHDMRANMIVDRLPCAIRCTE